MTAPSTTQTKRRKLLGIILGAVLLPALVALAIPDQSADTEVATVPIAVESAPVETAAPSTATTEAPTTTSAPAPTVSVSTTTPKKSTTTTTPPTTLAVTKVAAHVAPTTTTTTAVPVAVAPAPPAPSNDASAFLACIKQRESHGSYTVVSGNGVYHGAYQFSQSTWNSAAQHAGRTDLVGVAPSKASPADQDAMALALYNWQGKAPWGGHC